MEVGRVYDSWLAARGLTREHVYSAHRCVAGCQLELIYANKDEHASVYICKSSYQLHYCGICDCNARTIRDDIILCSLTGCVFDTTTDVSDRASVGHGTKLELIRAANLAGAARQGQHVFAAPVSALAQAPSLAPTVRALERKNRLAPIDGTPTNRVLGTAGQALHITDRYLPVFKAATDRTISRSARTRCPRALPTESDRDPIAQTVRLLLTSPARIEVSNRASQQLLDSIASAITVYSNECQAKREPLILTTVLAISARVVRSVKTRMPLTLAPSRFAETLIDWLVGYVFRAWVRFVEVQNAIRAKVSDHGLILLPGDETVAFVRMSAIQFTVCFLLKSASGFASQTPGREPLITPIAALAAFLLPDTLTARIMPPSYEPPRTPIDGALRIAERHSIVPAPNFDLATLYGTRNRQAEFFLDAEKLAEIEASCFESVPPAELVSVTRAPADRLRAWAQLISNGTNWRLVASPAFVEHFDPGQSWFTVMSIGPIELASCELLVDEWRAVSGRLTSLDCVARAGYSVLVRVLADAASDRDMADALGDLALHPHIYVTSQLAPALTQDACFSLV